MSEKAEKITLEDIITPNLKVGETSIVFQRHGVYNRDISADTAGSITPESSAEMHDHDRKFFDDLLKQDGVHVLFVSSDTQYGGKGHRSLETAQVAQDAAIEAMLDADIDPKERIINLNPAYMTARHDETDQDIRPIAGIREPQIFNPADVSYLEHLQKNHGYADEAAKVGLAPKAWAMHEMDAEPEARLKTGAEGQEELIARTEKSLSLLERYARIWHANNPGKRLVIWTASHYDTVNPLVKKVDGTLRNEDGSLSDAYQPVDYGGGVLINIPASPEAEITLERRGDNVKPVEFGKVATKGSMTRLNQPKF